MFFFLGKVDCATISSDKNKPCIFPFVRKGEDQYECVKSGSSHWCATELKSNGEYKKWGHCSDSCPLAEDFDCSLSEGKYLQKTREKSA